MTDNDFESRFILVLDGSQELVSRANLVLQQALMSDVGPESMPEIPVWRLHLAATSTFLGVLQCLRTRHSSLGAFSLLRGLIEAWTHLYFIADNSEADTAAIRAIRFEAGVLSEWASVKKAMNPDTDYDELQRDNDATILRLCIANGRNELPKRRTYKDVNPTLQKMAKFPTLERLELIHSASSVAVHASAADFLLETTTTGVTVVWASPGRRCAWLQMAIMCYDYLTISALSSVLDSSENSAIKDLHERWQLIYNDPLLMSAVGAENAEESDEQ